MIIEFKSSVGPDEIKEFVLEYYKKSIVDYMDSGGYKIILLDKYFYRLRTHRTYCLVLRTCDSEGTIVDIMVGGGGVDCKVSPRLIFERDSDSFKFDFWCTYDFFKPLSDALKDTVDLRR